MIEICKGIVARFQANSTLATAMPNSPFLDMAAERTAFPYCVYSIIGARPDMGFDSLYLQEFMVRFSIFHTDDATLTSLHETLHTVFDRAKFSLQSPALCLTTIRMEEFIRYEGSNSNADGQGRPAYRALTGYSFKTLTSF